MSIIEKTPMKLEVALPIIVSKKSNSHLPNSPEQLKAIS